MDALGRARLTRPNQRVKAAKPLLQDKKFYINCPFAMAVALGRSHRKKLRRQGARDKNVLPKERIMTAQIRSIDPLASPPDREATALVLFRSAARHTH